MRRFLERVLHLLRVRRPDADVDREIDAHLALMQEAYEARGLAPDTARRAARIAFGGVDQAKALHRDARSFPWLEDAREDIAHGFRLLRRSPVFTLTAAFSLAIGIGGNTAIFTVANGLLFRPPAGVTDPDRLIDIGSSRSDGGLNPLPYATYAEVARRIASLSDVFAQDLFPQAANLMSPGVTTAEPVRCQSVSANYFAVLGTPPAVGRMFAPGDTAAAVLDYKYWQRRFNGDERIVGSGIRINDRLVGITGVVASGFQGTGTDAPDIWLAITPSEGAGSVMAGGRMRPGVSAAATAAELATIGDTLNREAGITSRAPRLAALPLSRAGGNRNLVLGAAVFLMALVSIVLAIACANVVSILLTRSSARAREMTLRAALGAGRGRIVRQLLTETTVLYLVGGVLGIGLAEGALPLTRLLPALPTSLAVPLTVDWRVLLFALLLTLTSAALSGALPALKGSKIDPGLSLKDVARSSSSRAGFRSAFVVGQVTLSVLLIVIGALFVRVLRYAGAADPGFDPQGVDLATVDRSVAAGRGTGTADLWRNVIDRVRHLPDVDAASLARVPPGGFEGIGLGVVEGGNGPTPSNTFAPSWNIVDTGYFMTLRIPLLAGRDFEAHDNAGAPPVVIVSQLVAKRFWPGQDAVGQSLTLTVANEATRQAERRVATVVGVVGDIKSSSLVDGLAEPYVYLPVTQSERTGMTTAMSIVARRSHGPRSASAFGIIVRDVDPTLILVSTSSLADSVALGLTPQRVLASVAGAAGLVGLLLASMGLYGVTAYAVALRRREFAIRLALGAPRARVVQMVLRQGLTIVGLGVSLGLVLAVGVGRILSGFFYGLPAMHLPTLFATIAGFALIGGLACVVPAGHAVRTGLTRALQED